jgi:phosphate transport system permease protein
MTIETNMKNYPQRRATDQLLRGCTVLATALAIVPLILIIGYVLVIGGSALNAEFFTETYKPPVSADLSVGGGEVDPITGLPLDFTLPGEEGAAAPAEASSEPDLTTVEARGGVLHGIVGTLMVTIVALLIALPIGIMAGVFLSEYPGNIVATVVRFCSDVLSGAPSIVIGVVGYVLIVRRFETYSGIAGAIALTFLMVPTITRTTEEILKLVPNATREAAMAMGAPTWYSTLTVVIPTALTGIVTGALLAFARGAGETAPLLLTIQGNNNLSLNLFEPIAALPLLTYKYIESPFPAENQLAWGTAFVLMMLVLIVNLLVRVVTARIRGGVR